MPPPLDPNNLYAADGPGRLSRVRRCAEVVEAAMMAVSAEPLREAPSAC
jgi:hypothetical protein